MLRNKKIHWTMQVNIVAVFLFLIILFSIIIILFTNHQNYKGIFNLSESRMQNENDSIIQTIDSVTGQTELLAHLTKGLINNVNDVSDKNKELTDYLLNALVTAPEVSKIIIATNDGALLSVSNLSLVQKPHYHLNPVNKLPQSAKYAVREIIHSGPMSHEIWEYKNTSLETIASEKIISPTYDPRVEMWYSQVATWPTAKWYVKQYSSEEGGLAFILSTPVATPDRKVFAVINVTLSLNRLSNIIAREQMGLTGKAFLFDQHDHLLIPVISPSGNWRNLAEMTYSHFQKDKNKNFMIKAMGIDYLVNFTNYPLDIQNQFWVVTIVPFNDFYGPILKTNNQTILVIFILLILFGFLVYFSSRAISSPLVNIAKESNRIRDFNFKEPTPIKSHISEIINLVSSFNTMRVALRSFVRYVPKEIIHTLIKQGQEIVLGGQRRELVIMFSDIENFTTLAESMPIEALTPELDEYFTALSNAIMTQEGTIDKYIGDSIMAFWNAPQKVIDPAEKASLACLRCLQICNSQDKTNIFLKAHTRFGIHGGEVIVGNIGTHERLNYTVIGTVVNTTARLQVLNKKYQTSIIISEIVHEQIGTFFVTRPLDFVTVEGRTKGITLFELVGVKDTESELAVSPEMQELCQRFAFAYEKFHAGEIQEARVEFMNLHEKFPSDVPTKIYCERLKEE